MVWWSHAWASCKIWHVPTIQLSCSNIWHQDNIKLPFIHPVGISFTTATPKTKWVMQWPVPFKHRPPRWPVYWFGHCVCAPFSCDITRKIRLLPQKCPLLWPYNKQYWPLALECFPPSIFPGFQGIALPLWYRLLTYSVFQKPSLITPPLHLAPQKPLWQGSKLEAFERFCTPGLNSGLCCFKGWSKALRSRLPSSGFPPHPSVFLLNISRAFPSLRRSLCILTSSPLYFLKWTHARIPELQAQEPQPLAHPLMPPHQENSVLPVWSSRSPPEMTLGKQGADKVPKTLLSETKMLSRTYDPPFLKAL